MKIIIFISTLLVSTLTFADCSIKVINHTSTHFEELNARGTVSNLLIPICTQNPSTDEETLKNCAEDPKNTLFVHPHAEGTCQSVSKNYIHLQITATRQNCISHSLAGTGNVVLNYPQDFNCK